MIFIRYLILALVLFSCAKKNSVIDINKMYPPYKLINLYSLKINPETGLVLYSYGINIGISKEYQHKKGIANFSVGYYLYKNQSDELSLDNARGLITFIAEKLLQEINSSPDVAPDLAVNPLTGEFLKLSIHVVDQNKIELGQGVSTIYLWNGRIQYKGYKIEEYREVYPAKGKHYTILEESYAEALDTVKRNGSLKYL